MKRCAPAGVSFWSFNLLWKNLLQTDDRPLAGDVIAEEAVDVAVKRL